MKRNGDVDRALDLLRSGKVTTIAEACRQTGAAKSTVSDRLSREAPSDLERVFFFPDTHCPYHDERAWSVAMQAARGFKPDVIVHLGDLADFYAVSSHSKDPRRKLRFSDEREMVRGLRAEMDSLGATRKVFIEGNHEDRLKRYIQDKAPELSELIETDDQLQLSENGWDFTPYKEYAKVGKLHIIHDTGHSGKYTTARALETFQASVVIGHHHALGYLVTGDARGKHQVGAQFGWLGDVSKVDYLHRVKALRNWAHGFGTGLHDVRTGIVYLTPHPIVNYTACVGGRVYSA